jgi:hypothetical protein
MYEFYHNAPQQPGPIEGRAMQIWAEERMKFFALRDAGMLQEERPPSYS